MRLPLDPGDVLGDGCWETIKRVLSLVSTLWLGCMMVIIARFLGEMAGAAWSGAWGDMGEIILGMMESILWVLLWAPFYFLLSIWGLLFVPLIGLVLFLMFRTEKEVIWVWYVGVILIGVITMADFVGIPDDGEDVVAWIGFVLLAFSLAAGCWLFKGWKGNMQALHLQEVSAENEMRRLEMEQKFGTKSFGQGESTRE